MPERKRKQPVVVALRPDLDEAAIAERAYYRWLARNRPIGDGTEDWFAARADLERENRTAPVGKPAKRASR